MCRVPSLPLRHSPLRNKWLSVVHGGLSTILSAISTAGARAEDHGGDADPKPLISVHSTIATPINFASHRAGIAMASSCTNPLCVPSAP
jgi:hypothetical protein